MTMMHSLHKEAAEMLCDCIESRIKDGEVPHDEWIDFQGNQLPPNCLCPITLQDKIASCDDQDPCMGIQLNIWERAKKRRYWSAHLLWWRRIFPWWLWCPRLLAHYTKWWCWKVRTIFHSLQTTRQVCKISLRTLWFALWKPGPPTFAWW